MPLFEFFCLARILPYMTTTIEKSCIIAGLQRIAEEIGLPYTKIDPIQSPSSEGSLSDEGENILENEKMTTVIVPALGADMTDIYADGQIKLLAVNVQSPKSLFPVYIGHANIYLIAIWSSAHC